MATLKKELILISPPVSSYLIRTSIFLMYGSYTPLALHVLAALTPKEYKITFVHRKLFWRRKDFTPGVLVGITCVTTNAPVAYKIADGYRQAGAFVVMGGLHVSVLPEEALQHCHSVVIGEAESVWGQVIKDFENGSLNRIYQGEPLEDPFSPVEEYFLGLSPKQLSRTGILIQRGGCGFRCEFCGMPITAKCRFAKIEQVIPLVKKATQARFLGFFSNPTLMLIGDNVYSNPTYAKNLFRALQDVGVRWFAGCSLDIAFDDEALALARKSGCRVLLIGFESIYPLQLAKTSVHQMRSDKDYDRAIKRIKSHGIPVIGLFIAGFDNYSHIDYLRMLRFLARPLRFFFASVNVLTPFPGSPIYERFYKEGRLLKAGWGAYTLIRVVYRPARTSRYSLMFWFVVTKLTAFLMSTLGLMNTLFMLSIYTLYFIGFFQWLYYFIYDYFFALSH
jgi:radical SAM superfamily enzyme YgiQ (UPF0313 family)